MEISKPDVKFEDYAAALDALLRAGYEVVLNVVLGPRKKWELNPLAIGALTLEGGLFIERGRQGADELLERMKSYQK